MTTAEKAAKARRKYDELTKALRRETDPAVRRQIISRLYYWAKQAGYN
jgi:hypothetical protein